MLPERTQTVFDDIKHCDGIDAFLLVGGTALAMRIGHRISEDLDFQTPDALDPRLINSIMECLRTKGHTVMQLPNPELEREYEDTGIEAHYAQMQFSVDGVKVEFFQYIPFNGFRFDPDRVVSSPVPGVNTGKVQVATTDTIFYLKCLLIPTRSRHRDLFDLLTLINEGHYGIQDVFKIAEEQQLLHDHYVRQLLYRKKSADDPGVTIPEGKAPTYKQVVDGLQAHIDEWQIERAKTR